MPSTVACLCGQVAITLAADRPVCCCECCCCDCAATMQWCRTTNNNNNSRISKEKEVDVEPSPARLFYFDNDITDIQGEDHLMLLKLRDSSASLRIATTCCASVLLNLHWLYFQRRIMVLDQTCRLKYEEMTDDPVQPYARIQTKFWNAITDKPLPPTNIPSYACGDPLWVLNSQLFQKVVMAKVPSQSERQGETAQDLIGRLQQRQKENEKNNNNKLLVVLGREEPQLPGHFQTGCGMFSLTLRNPLATAGP